MLIAVEGIDGAGKQTLVGALLDRLRDGGGACEHTAFPRYDATPFGPVVTAALHGDDPRLLASITGMSMTYAVDRWQWWHTDRTARRATDHVVIDRWCASNAAYGSARVASDGGDIDGTAAVEFRDWVADLEFERLALPRPDVTVLLATDDALAGERRAGRTSTDAYEADGGLQARALAAYRSMADSGWGGQWIALDPLDAGGARRPADELAELVLAAIDA